MTTTNYDTERFPLGFDRYGVRTKAKMTAEGDVSAWTLFNGNVTLQAQGPVDAATIAIERSTIDPSGGVNNAVQVAEDTGSGAAGVTAVAIGVGNAWYRAKNKATFGPANTVAARSLLSLEAAINGLQPVANGFFPGTAPQPLVHAGVGTTALKMALTAATAGVAGNSIATTETLANGSFANTTLTGGADAAAAVGTLTFSTGAAANNDTVTINGRVYTFKTALTTTDSVDEVLRGSTLTNSRDNLLLAINRTGTGAARTGTFATNVVAGDTIRIGARTYTFVATLDQNVPNQVFVGADLTASRNNLVAAINSSAGGSAKYSQSTPPNTEVTASAVSTDQITVTAIAVGLVGQDIRTLDTSSHFSWAGAALTGGTGPGITYGSGTVINADVAAAAVSTNQLTATAKVAGTAGNAITTTESGANTAWGAGTLASGANAAFATGVLTLTDVPANTETVTIGAVVYTFKTTPAVVNDIAVAALTIDVVLSGEQLTNV